jgi:hypothetical protein
MLSRSMSRMTELGALGIELWFDVDFAGEDASD